MLFDGEEVAPPFPFSDPGPNSNNLGQTINIQNKASDLDLSQVDDTDLSWLFPGTQIWQTT